MFTTLDGNTVSLEIQHPDNFDFDASVLIVKGVLKHLTPKQRIIAEYWGDVPRPNQLDQRLITAICTPKFPSYPSGHSVISGTAEVILSYFFPPEAERLKELAEENSISRLYGGVHFIEDITEGLRLGRQIGRIIVEELVKQSDANQSGIDIPVTESRNADLMPPPYEQVIAYPSRVNDCDLPLLP